MAGKFLEYFHIACQKFPLVEVVKARLVFQFDVEKELTNDDCKNCLQTGDSNATTEEKKKKEKKRNVVVFIKNNGGRRRKKLPCHVSLEENKFKYSTYW